MHLPGRLRSLVYSAEAATIRARSSILAQNEDLLWTQSENWTELNSTYIDEAACEFGNLL